MNKLFSAWFFVDQKIIDFLTMITWWTEVRFENDNVFLAVQANQLGWFLLLVSAILLVTNYPHLLPLWLILFLWFMILVLSLLCFFMLVFSNLLRDSLIKYYPQGNPNINREKGMTPRLVSFGFLATWSLVFLVSKETFAFSMMAGAFFNSLKLSLLACDSIPPNEKKRRKEANLAYKNQAVPQPV